MLLAVGGESRRIILGEVPPAKPEQEQEPAQDVAAQWLVADGPAREDGSKVPVPRPRARCRKNRKSRRRRITVVAGSSISLHLHTTLWVLALILMSDGLKREFFDG